MKNSITLENENGCVMDSDKDSISPPIGPSAKPSDSYINKEFSNSSFTGTGFSNTKGYLTFFPVQVQGESSPKTTILCQFSYTGTWTGSTGGFGQTAHTVVLNDLAPSGQFVEVKGVTINCSIDNESFAVYACPVDVTKSNNIQFMSVNTDPDSPTKTRTFKVTISGMALIDNTNFGLGQLFPNN